jgi:hypothetical protein
MSDSTGTGAGQYVDSYVSSDIVIVVLLIFVLLFEFDTIQMSYSLPVFTQLS